MSSSVPNSWIGSVPSSCTIRISALEAQAFAISSIGDVEHQRAGAGAAVLLVERQPEQVVLGEQLAQVPRVLGLGVDLGRARRDLLAHDLADRVAEVDMVVGERVRCRQGCRGHGGSVEHPSEGVSAADRNGHYEP